MYQARTGCPSNPAKVTSQVSTSVQPGGHGDDVDEHVVPAGVGDGRRPELVEVGGLGDVGAVALELVEREVEQGHGQATVAGGAVLSRITSSVPSSMRGLAGASPRAMPSTMRVAVAAISWRGWWMVVSGGPIHSVTGRSS